MEWNVLNLAPNSPQRQNLPLAVNSVSTDDKHDELGLGCNEIKNPQEKSLRSNSTEPQLGVQ